MKRIQSLTDTYTLSNGVQIPAIGFGTWQMPNNEDTTAIVSHALEVGYRHIDTAQAYRNEEAVGRAVKKSDVKREDIFITTKIDNLNHGYDNTVRSLHKSLELLDTDVIDLVLIHWPNPKEFRPNWQEANSETWRAMEEFYERGQIRALGISNFHPHHMDALLKTAKVKPMVNQIMLCPGLVQEEIVAYCKEAGILVEAYSPLGTGKALDAPELKELAEKYDKSPAQIALAWSLSMGFLPLPKTSTMKRVAENADIFDVDLTKEEVDRLISMETDAKLLQDPDA